MTKKVVQRGSNGNVLGGCSIAVRCVQRGVQLPAMMEMCHTVRCVRMGFKGNALGGILHQVVSRGGSMVMS